LLDEDSSRLSNADWDRSPPRSNGPARKEPDMFADVMAALIESCARQCGAWRMCGVGDATGFRLTRHFVWTLSPVHCWPRSSASSAHADRVSLPSEFTSMAPGQIDQHPMSRRLRMQRSRPRRAPRPPWSTATGTSMFAGRPARARSSAAGGLRWACWSTWCSRLRAREPLVWWIRGRRRPASAVGRGRACAR
jgi:hypothetical protein